MRSLTVALCDQPFLISLLCPPCYSHPCCIPLSSPPLHGWWLVPMLSLAIETLYGPFLWAPTLTKDGQIPQACVSALYYTLMLNRSSEFSVPGCYSCPNVWKIIVCYNPGHQKAFLLHFEMNVIKFITLGIVPGTKSSPRSGMPDKSLEWSFDQDGAVCCHGVHHYRWTQLLCTVWRSQKTG